MMQRNLRRRVEVLFPVQDSALCNALIRILNVHLRDNVKSWRLNSDGTYEKIHPVEGEAPCNSQKWLIKYRGAWHGWR